MNPYYECLNCGWEGDDPDEKTHEEHHPYGSTTATEVIVDSLHCPECASERLDEIIDEGDEDELDFDEGNEDEG